MTKEQKVGLFFTVGMILAFLIIEMTVGSGLLHEEYHLFVNFTDVQGLNRGDAVRVAGLKMGKVDDVQLEADHVRVRLRLRTEAKVHRDSVARLDFQALSGSRFITISVGSADAPVLKDGDTLPGEQIADVSAMVDQLAQVGRSVTELAESFNRNQDELLRNVNDLIIENRKELGVAIAHMSSLTEKLDSGVGTVGKLINDPALYDQAQGMLESAHLVLVDLQEVSSRLARGEGSLGRLLREDTVYDEARETLANLTATARNLETISSNIRDGQGTLGRLVVDDSLYVEAENAVRSLDRVATTVEDQAPISILGTFVSTLF